MCSPTSICLYFPVTCPAEILVVVVLALEQGDVLQTGDDLLQTAQKHHGLRDVDGSDQRLCVFQRPQLPRILFMNGHVALPKKRLLIANWLYINNSMRQFSLPIPKGVDSL